MTRILIVLSLCVPSIAAASLGPDPTLERTFGQSPASLAWSQPQVADALGSCGFQLATPTNVLTLASEPMPRTGAQIACALPAKRQ